MVVICDTNVWYEIATGKFIPPPNIQLVGTAFSMYELVTTEMAVSNPCLLQEAIRAVHDFSAEIIPVNPFEYVLTNYSSQFSEWDLTWINNMLNTFENMLSTDLSLFKSIPTDLVDQVRDESRQCRRPSLEYAEYINAILPQKRKIINQTVGRSHYLAESQSELTKWFTLEFLNSYVVDKNFRIDTEIFEWESINLFLKVTENFFKKLETTKEMKVDSNDITDWLNLLYVKPEYKYLTFDGKWRNFILNDPATSKCLFC